MLCQLSQSCAGVPRKELVSFPQSAFSHAVSKVDAILQHALTQQLEIPSWEREELQACAKVARHNVMACKLLDASLGEEGPAPYTGSWEFKVHWHFPTLQLKRSVASS
jgi:hypothetical protein